MIKLQTGISTDRDFIKVMKEKGQDVKAEFPADTLRDQLDALSENIKITFESTNETILAAVNEVAVPVEKPKATVAYLSGLDREPEMSDGIINIQEGSTITYYEADESVGRMVAGNRFGFKVNSPEELNYEDYKNTNISRTMTKYDGTVETDNVVWSDVQDGERYCEIWPLITEGLKEVKFELAWSEDNIQTIVINLPENIILEQPKNKTKEVANEETTNEEVVSE